MATDILRSVRDVNVLHSLGSNAMMKLMIMIGRTRSPSTNVMLVSSMAEEKQTRHTDFDVLRRLGFL